MIEDKHWYPEEGWAIFYSSQSSPFGRECYQVQKIDALGILDSDLEAIPLAKAKGYKLDNPNNIFEFTYLIPINDESSMSKQHTPGPWTYEASTKTVRSIPSNYWIATMDSWDGAVNHEANARLIAAAPDLLEALEMLLASPDLCLENLEPETIEIMNHCNNLIDHLK